MSIATNFRSPFPEIVFATFVSTVVYLSSRRTSGNRVQTGECRSQCSFSSTGGAWFRTCMFRPGALQVEGSAGDASGTTSWSASSILERRTKHPCWLTSKNFRVFPLSCHERTVGIRSLYLQVFFDSHWGSLFEIVLI